MEYILVWVFSYMVDSYGDVITQSDHYADEASCIIMREDVLNIKGRRDKDIYATECKEIKIPLTIIIKEK